MSGQPIRKRVKEANKVWLPVQGILESGTLVDAGQLQDLAEAWKKLSKLADKHFAHFHMTDLYAGKGVYAGVTIPERVEIFENARRACTCS